MPSPISDSRRWTRKTPTSGAAKPTSSAASSACRMKSSASSSVTIGPPDRGRGGRRPARPAARAARRRARRRGGGREGQVLAGADGGDAAGSRRRRCGRRRPATMRVTMSARAASSCVTMTMVVPRSASRASTCARTSWLAGSTPAVGSSITSTSGLAGEGAGDEHAPLLAAGQRGDVGVGPVGQADVVERARMISASSAGAQARPPPPAVRQPADRDDLLDRGAHRGRQGVPLRDVAEAGVVLEALARGAEQLAPRPRAGRSGRGCPGRAWTCPSRWGRAARPPRPGRRTRSTSRTTTASA